VVAATGGHPAGDKAQRQCVQHWGCMGSAPVRRGGGVLTEMANRHEGAEAIAGVASHKRRFHAPNVE
jgi:hypothetical protein